MSNAVEHAECADSLAAFALDALPEAEAQRVQRHLNDCQECRATYTWLRAAVDVLPASVPPLEPSPDLKTRVMSVVETEAELLRAAGAAADRPPRKARPERWRSRWSPALGFAAALSTACVVAVVVLLAVGGGSGTRTVQARITSSALTGRVIASLQIQGSAAALKVSGLPVPATNRVYELWVQHDGGPPERAGTFVVQSGSVDVADRVKRGDVVLMTIEPSPGTVVPTTAPLLEAPV